MVNTYKYSIISITPNDLRGEMLNIGLIVRGGDSFDVHMSGASKLNAVFGGKWGEYVDRLRDDILSFASSGGDVFSSLQLFYSNVHTSLGGEFVASSGREKADILKELNKTFILKKNPKRSPRKIGINDEISSLLNHHKILGEKADDIFNHKVVRDYLISSEENLKADFAVKNGRLHVATTLDLRSGNVGIDRAALKAIVLDKAKTLVLSASDVRRVAVYASSDPKSHSYNVNILKDYSNDTYNWADLDERQAFMSSFEQAAGVRRLDV